MKIITELHEFTWDMFRGLPNSYYHSINKLDCKIIHKPGLSSTYQFNSVFNGSNIEIILERGANIRYPNMNSPSEVIINKKQR